MVHVDQAPLHAKLENYKREAKSDAVRNKLDNLHQVCKDLAEDGRLTVKAVVGEYNSRFEGSGSIAEPSIRNKREGANLYNKLFMDWSEWAKGEIKSQPRPGEMILPAELNSIHPVQLRHRVGLMVAEAHSLRSQLSILRKVDATQVVSVQGFASTMEPKPTIGKDSDLPTLLEVEDLEAVRDFLDPRKLKERGLALSANRALVASTGQTIADPGFFDALHRLSGSQA